MGSAICRICLLVVGVCVVLNLFPHVYLNLFGQDAAFVAMGTPVLRLIAFAMIIMSMATVWLQAVTGTGNSRMTFLIEVASIVFYCLYVYLTLEVYHLPIFWGWASELLYWLVMLSLSFWYLSSGKWRKKVIR